MEGISKEILESIDSWDYETPQQLIMDIIDKCKELPDQQWQTIDGFKSENHECYCFVVHSDRVPMLNFYHAGKFYVDETCYKLWVGTITHVMPITTPEAPK